MSQVSQNIIVLNVFVIYIHCWCCKHLRKCLVHVAEAEVVVVDEEEVEIVEVLVVSEVVAEVFEVVPEEEVSEEVIVEEIEVVVEAGVVDLVVPAVEDHSEVVVEEVTVAEEDHLLAIVEEDLLVPVEEEVQHFPTVENFSALKSKLACNCTSPSMIIQIWKSWKNYQDFIQSQHHSAKRKF